MKKVLHVLEYSLPRVAGYSIRSKYIIDNQKREGISPVVITSPLHGKTERPLEQFEELESVRHYRTGEYNKLDLTKPLPSRILSRYQYSRAYLKAIKWVAEKENIHIIHAHSSYLNGVRANAAAKYLGIPSVYEVRGLWHDTAAVNIELDKTHWKYRFINHMDNKAILGADRVVTLSNQLKNELLEKGVSKDRLFVVPNGVDTTIFSPREKRVEIQKKYHLERKIVFGFIGSIGRLEGLSLVLEYFHDIINKNKNVCFLLIGNGDEVSSLKDIVQKKKLNEYVTFTGRVPHEQILDFYSVVDILLYPRINAKVCHKVTPLKPLEAMAMEKVVIASDVGGLKELVKEGKNGLLFHAEDGSHLIQRCLELIENPGLIKNLGKKGREWVVQERDWSRIIKLYNNVYDGL